MTANANTDRRYRHASRQVDTANDHTGRCVICDGTGRVAEIAGGGTCGNCKGTGKADPTAYRIGDRVRVINAEGSILGINELGTVEEVAPTGSLFVRYDCNGELAGPTGVMRFTPAESAAWSDHQQREQAKIRAQQDPIDHLNYVVQAIRDATLEDAPDTAEILATCASEADARVIAERWARNEDYDIVGVYDTESGDITVAGIDF